MAYLGVVLLILALLIPLAKGEGVIVPRLGRVTSGHLRLRGSVHVSTSDIGRAIIMYPPDPGRVTYLTAVGRLVIIIIARESPVHPSDRRHDATERDLVLRLARGHLRHRALRLRVTQGHILADGSTVGDRGLTLRDHSSRFMQPSGMKGP
jgi:hypothetical protein